MEFGVLGPLLTLDASGSITLASAKQRALLAALLLEKPSTVVSAQRLIDELWGEAPPASAGKALQVHVSQLRRALGPGQPIVTLPTGYALEIDADAVDLHRFELLLGKARELREAGDGAQALEAMREALALWRGQALADVTLLGRRASEADRLEDLRATANAERLELELDHGGAPRLIGELKTLVAEDPYRERMHGLLMLALYRAGRQAEALEAFRNARTVLVEELGIEPGPELVRLEAAILAQDPALDAPSKSRASPSQSSSARVGPGSDAAPIPRAVSSLVGREAELDAALELIDRPDVRLVTLTGTGGIGKTRMALELAERLGSRSRVVELAAITDADRVMPAIAAAIGVGDSSEGAIATALEADPVVLFLDNFEQVLSAAPVVASLLGAAATPTLVVTSRAPLRIAGEHELPLPPLATDLAVELFVRRARDQDPRFAPDGDAIERIAGICGQIDGLPLAIELAAARTRVLTPAQIFDRIADRLDLLTGGRRDAPERHRTLRATIAWSYELLEPDEQRLMTELAVFRGGWSLEACEAVTGTDVLDALSALVDHSLVVNDGGRFTMLETVREFAVERLRESGDADTVARRHALWCASLAESAEPELRGAEQSNWYARLDVERENLRAAATWGAAAGEPELAMRIDAALWRFWLARGAAPEVRDLLRSAVTSGRGEPVLRAKALNAAGVLAGATSEFAVARELLEQALELGRQLDDPPLLARPLMNLGLVAVYTDDYDTALARYAEAAQIWQELGDAWGESAMCQNRAIVLELLNRYDEALPLLERSVELARKAGDQMHIAQTVVDLAKLLLLSRLDDPRIAPLMREGLELCGALDERRQIIECLEVLAVLSARTGAPETGAELIGAAAAERERAGAQRMLDERSIFDTAVHELEDALGQDGFARARARGHEWSLTEAIEAALGATER